MFIILRVFREVHKLLLRNICWVPLKYKSMVAVGFYISAAVLSLLLYTYLTNKSMSLLMFESSLSMELFHMELKGFYRDYEMLRGDPEECKNKTMFIGIMSVGNSLEARRQRQAIRDYVVHNAKTYNVIYKFFIGHQYDLRTDWIQSEISKYNDIVYYTAQDHYRNNFIKWHAMHQYHQAYCSDVKYFVKLDDDTALDLDRLFKWIPVDFDGLTHGKEDFMVCNRFIGRKPVRVKEDKRWYVPLNEYPNKFWPSYCKGYFVLTTNTTVGKIIEASKKIPLIHMDDVLFTGVAAKVAKVPIIDFFGIREGLSDKFPCTDEGLPYSFVLHFQKTPESMYRSTQDLKNVQC